MRAQLAFKGVGPLPMAAIKRARADLEGAADAEAREHQRRLDALCAASQARPSSPVSWGALGCLPRKHGSGSSTVWRFRVGDLAACLCPKPLCCGP